MESKHLKEIGVRGEIAIEIINELHTERLNYDSEYLPLINSAEDIPVLLSEINNLQSAQLKAFNDGYDVQQKHIDETVRQYGNEVDRLKKENAALRSNSDSMADTNKRLADTILTLKKALETEKCALLSACKVFQELLDCENPLHICKGCEPDEDCALHLLDYFRQQAREQEGKNDL